METKSSLSLLELNPEDLDHEEHVLKNQYSLKAWWRYLEFKQKAPPKVRSFLYERALKELPGSYKLWYNYVTERLALTKNKCLTDPIYESVNTTFERALVYMYKMPVMWVTYFKFLTKQKKITKTRKTFDRALRSLPMTQHHMLWNVCIPWVCKIKVPETAICLYKRYLKIEPEDCESYIDYLIEVGEINEAAHQLVKLANSPNFVSRKGQSKHEIWIQLCDLVSKNPTKIKNLKVEPIIRQGLRKFTNEVGKLWVALAEFYIRKAAFSKARDIFEEGINTVMTVRDFSQIWNAYTRFEDTLIEAQMQDQETMTEEEELDFDLQLARYEELINQRPLLVSSVLLRQNPHNVPEWHKRVKLFDDPIKKAEVYNEAITTVDPKKATGKPHSLWVMYAKLYEQNDDLEGARAIYVKATEVDFRGVDELASVWCEYVEMEIRHGNYQKALKLLQKATIVPRVTKVGRDQPVQRRLFKSTKLWCFYADLEESLGTFLSTKAVYDKILDLRIATPQIVLNYAKFLEEHNHFEESFKAYERGVALFHYPYVMNLWIAYITKFLERYKGSKLERVRDLFEEAITSVPAKESKTLYIMYAHVEEQYGLARHAMSVYDRACRAVEDEDKTYMYSIYIARATEFFGVTRTREIYDQAIANLPDDQVKDACLRYADLERKLGEIDRARSIYTHCSQYCDPATETNFWDVWYTFEVRHGNEDTFREMLRIKRSVAASYNTQINFMSAEMLSAAKKADEVDRRKQLKASGVREDEMQALEENITPSMEPSGEAITFTSRKVVQDQNPEEISLDDVMDEDEEEEEDGDVDKVEIQQKEVPDAVFGGLKGATTEDNSKPIGALARFKARQNKNK